MTDEFNDCPNTKIMSMCAEDQPVAQLMSICESCTSFGESLPRVLPDLSASAAYELASQHYQPLYEAMDRRAPRYTKASLS